jgi:hypothetical protein
MICHSSVKYDSHMQQEIMNVKLSNFLENQVYNFLWISLW